MPSDAFDHLDPERFVAGTVGLPGERTFYLQVRAEGTVTVRIEKIQVEMLADRIDELLDAVRLKDIPGHGIPAEPEPRYVDNAGLEMPVDAEFQVGTMSIGWDTAVQRLILECYELTREDAEAGSSSESPESDGVDRRVLRVRLDGARAREFARRAAQLVEAGREECPLCALPLDPSGHICPRLNGVPR